MTERLELLTRWLRQDCGFPAFDIAPASADASFRRYFRVSFAGETRIVMDAPPDKENVGPFVALAQRLHGIGLNVPRIFAQEPEQGFLLLSDLGDTQYLTVLDEGTVDRLYGDALGALVVLQTCGPGAGEVPGYDRELLLAEMGLFRDWYLERHLGIVLTEKEDAALRRVFEGLADSALAQPRVCVHRDYHSRNLMVDRHNPGIIDFQDAVYGPVTYDLVSLLRDCYIAWPGEQVESWVRGYHDLALDSGILKSPCEEQFLAWFDLMGVQRHLKAIGIFARLNHRDGKPGYLADIPRTLGYVREVAGRYRALDGLGRLISDRIEPAIDQQDQA